MFRECPSGDRIASSVQYAKARGDSWTRRDRPCCWVGLVDRRSIFDSRPSAVLSLTLILWHNTSDLYYFVNTSDMRTRHRFGDERAPRRWRQDKERKGRTRNTGLLFLTWGVPRSGEPTGASIMRILFACFVSLGGARILFLVSPADMS